MTNQNNDRVVAIKKKTQTAFSASKRFIATLNEKWFVSDVLINFSLSHEMPSEENKRWSNWNRWKNLAVNDAAALVCLLSYAFALTKVAPQNVVQSYHREGLAGNQIDKTAIRLGIQSLFIHLINLASHLLSEKKNGLPNLSFLIGQSFFSGYLIQKCQYHKTNSSPHSKAYIKHACIVLILFRLFSPFLP